MGNIFTWFKKYKEVCSFKVCYLFVSCLSTTHPFFPTPSRSFFLPHPMFSWEKVGYYNPHSLLFSSADIWSLGSIWCNGWRLSWFVAYLRWLAGAHAMPIFTYLNYSPFPSHPASWRSFCVSSKKSFLILKKQTNKQMQSIPLYGWFIIYKTSPLVVNFRLFPIWGFCKQCH